ARLGPDRRTTHLTVRTTSHNSTKREPHFTLRERTGITFQDHPPRLATPIGSGGRRERRCPICTIANATPRVIPPQRIPTIIETTRHSPRFPLGLSASAAHRGSPPRP